MISAPAASVNTRWGRANSALFLEIRYVLGYLSPLITDVFLAEIKMSAYYDPRLLSD